MVLPLVRSSKNNKFLQMKYRLLIVIFPLFFIFHSCDKTVDKNPLPEKFTKKVLIEEFGGEWCSFCVRGSKEFEDLLSQNPERYIGVSLHYEDPLELEYPSVVRMLLSAFEIISFPNTIVDRTDDESKSWEVQSAYRLSQGTKVGIKLKTKMVKNNLDISIDYSSFEDINNAYLTVYIIEDFVPESSPGAQNGGGGNYVHRHVLRQVLTKKSGDSIELIKNKVNSKSYTGIKLGEYKNSDVEVVAIIHRDASKAYEVLNTNSAKVNEESEW